MDAQKAAYAAALKTSEQALQNQWDMYKGAMESAHAAELLVKEKQIQDLQTANDEAQDLKAKLTTTSSELCTVKQQLEVANNECQTLKAKLSGQDLNIETLQYGLKNSREACDMAESKVAAYEDLMLIKGITRREMMKAWNNDGEIVIVANLMKPVRTGGKKRRT